MDKSLRKVPASHQNPKIKRGTDSNSVFDDKFRFLVEKSILCTVWAPKKLPASIPEFTKSGYISPLCPVCYDFFKNASKKWSDCRHILASSSGTVQARTENRVSKEPSGRARSIETLIPVLARTVRVLEPVKVGGGNRKL